MVRADAAVGASVAAATFTYLINRNNQNNGGAGVSGQSTATLNITADNDGYMWRLVRSGEVPDQEDVTAAGCDIVVLQNNRANQFLRDA
jgi:hypothetical protein